LAASEKESLGIWSQILAIIKNHINDQSYETWIAPTRLVRYDGERLTIEGPNQFFIDWVTQHHLDTIRDAGEVVLGFRPGIELTYRPSDGRSPFDPSGRRQSFLRRYTHDPRANKMLNGRYIFADFIVGGSNRMAHAASLAVAENPARVYNPLFIYGGVGLGKTHLAQAIGHFVLSENPRARVFYSSSETFMNELIFAIRQGKTLEFKNKYRNMDLLIIDDIQFLAGRESTQEEFFHTFNALYDNNKQIVVTSDRPPKEIKDLEERLISRFEWGLITDIQRPDLETRLAILKNKAAKDNLPIPEDVLTLIAENVSSSIRELEGSLIRLLAFANLSGGEINISLAKESLLDFMGKPRRSSSVADIQKAVAEKFEISVELMKSEKRSSRVVLPRQVAIYLSRQLTDKSLVEVGRLFGGRDHTTILHACRKIEKLIEEKPDFQREVAEIRQKFSMMQA
jgi:chromosomal replication initiator protein